ncbi:hypothetical protein AYC70_19385 [Salmonella enterica]|nr:hypothetical protein [Salmonella enterica]EBQ0859839.1 hypothetical protein [Salmonella enterica]
MTTQKLALTRDWQQLTDGTKTVYLDPYSGSAGWCVSDTQPQPDADFHILKMPITISPPTKVWIKSTREWKNDTVVTLSVTG